MSNTISKNSAKTVVINTTADDWHILPSVSVDVKNHSAVVVDSSFNYNKIYNLGTIHNTGTEAAFFLDGMGNLVQNDSAKASISGQLVGMELAGQQNLVVNKGEIDGGRYGILSTGSVNTVDNLGHVNGDTAGLSVAGAGINFLNRGTLDGDVAYISTDPMAGGGMLVNKGIVRGDSGIAIQGGSASDFISNFKTMIGDVKLGGGDDSFDFEHGRIKGDVFGGTGNDTFVIYTGKESFIEKANQGTDWVSTYVDYTLKTNFENLHLNGHDALNGTGNSADNWLEGNSNANVLWGLAGRDTLNGWEGNDRLIGGAGTDTFAFQLGSQRDTIVDFQASGKDADLIDLHDYDGLSGYKQLRADHMVQHGADVVIDFGNLDTITIKNVSLHDLSAADFHL